eukprot:Nitzschia sp. Nitz4//scaffold55_size114948//18816//19466//NITZ4_003885-RA/size114948-processed-gene-0.224-mRNA-1//-1//CDS//3329554482//9178//frame0
MSEQELSEDTGCHGSQAHFFTPSLEVLMNPLIDAPPKPPPRSYRKTFSLHPQGDSMSEQEEGTFSYQDGDTAYQPDGDTEKRNSYYCISAQPFHIGSPQTSKRDNYIDIEHQHRPKRRPFQWRLFLLLGLLFVGIRGRTNNPVDKPNGVDLGHVAEALLDGDLTPGEVSESTHLRSSKTPLPSPTVSPSDDDVATGQNVTVTDTVPTNFHQRPPLN